MAWPWRWPVRCRRRCGVELGATVPARGLYVTEPDLAEPGAAIGRWAATAFPLIRGALAAREISDAGPRP